MHFDVHISHIHSGSSTSPHSHCPSLAGNLLCHVNDMTLIFSHICKYECSLSWFPHPFFHPFQLVQTVSLQSFSRKENTKHTFNSIYMPIIRDRCIQPTLFVVAAFHHENRSCTHLQADCSSVHHHRPLQCRQGCDPEQCRLMSQTPCLSLAGSSYREHNGKRRGYYLRSWEAGKH